MTAEEKQSIGQMIDSLTESIRQKWNEMHEHLATPEQRKAIRAEIQNALSGLGNTIRQFDPRKAKAKKKASKKKTTAKKKAPAKKKSAAKRKKK